MARRGGKKKNLPFFEHLEELRMRVLFCLFITFAVFVFTYWKCEAILNFLIAPLCPVKKESVHLTLFQSGICSQIGISSSILLVSTKIEELFLVRVYTAIVSAVFACLPLYTWQLYRFFMPAISQKARRFSLLMLLAFLCLVYGGIVVTYYFVIPQTIEFLTKYSKSTLLPIPSYFGIGAYISTLVHFFVGFAVAFQVPVVLIMLCKVGLLNTTMLKKYRRIAIVAAFVFAAIVTPPDILSQIILAMIMIFMYEGVILFSHKI